MTTFLRVAGSRATRTFLQTLLTALLAVGTLDELNVATALGGALFAAALSVITSLVSLPEIGHGLGGVVGLAVAALIRGVRTAAQSALGVIGGAALFSDVDWRAVGMVAALAALTSVVSGLLDGLPEVEHVLAA